MTEYFFNKSKALAITFNILYLLFSANLLAQSNSKLVSTAKQELAEAGPESSLKGQGKQLDSSMSIGAQLPNFEQSQRESDWSLLVGVSPFVAQGKLSNAVVSDLNLADYGTQALYSAGLEWKGTSGIRRALNALITGFSIPAQYRFSFAMDQAPIQAATLANGEGEANLTSLQNEIVVSPTLKHQSLFSLSGKVSLNLGLGRIDYLQSSNSSELDASAYAYSFLAGLTYRVNLDRVSERIFLDLSYAYQDILNRPDASNSAENSLASINSNRFGLALGLNL